MLRGMGVKIDGRRQTADGWLETDEALSTTGRMTEDESGLPSAVGGRSSAVGGHAYESGRSSAVGGHAHETRLTPPSPLSLNPLRLTLPGDFSSAAFLIVAALITPGSEILLRGVGLNPTRTGLLDALWEMGADIQVIEQGSRGDEPAGSLLVRSSQLHGGRVSGERVVRMIDEFPAFAVAAAFAKGQTVVSEAEELRHKESDRITALCAGIRSLGVDAQETADGFVISGGRLPAGGLVDSCGDHRLAMSLALVGLAAQSPVTVQGAEIVAESFPGFVETLRNFGAVTN
jgi:3-phosphoshikimate 1-carboxyvinyltransferase